MADSIPGNLIRSPESFKSAEMAVDAVEGVGSLMADLTFGLCGYEDVPRELIGLNDLSK